MTDPERITKSADRGRRWVFTDPDGDRIEFDPHDKLLPLAGNGAWVEVPPEVMLDLAAAITRAYGAPAGSDPLGVADDRLRAARAAIEKLATEHEQTVIRFAVTTPAPPARTTALQAQAFRKALAAFDEAAGL